MKKITLLIVPLVLLFTSCRKADNNNLFFAPTIVRSVTQITLDEERTFVDSTFNVNLKLDFYRNEAYEAGLSSVDTPEYYTFMVINPDNNANASAPLWVYLHGGAQGYFDEQGVYQSYSTLNEHSWNHEESLMTYGK